ncbi:filamentous hemagglutinin N-terminal domain-containing protein [Paraburkholderia sp. MM5482-R1]|uniref:two-partner secretion domain-containing protein n=1 Tax=unclassified Paraburkholderia TaxID=2615204 RepID=UPI003D1E7A2A
MSRPELPRPARRALRRRQSAGRRWLVIGSALTGLCFAHATLAAGKLPQGGTYVAGTGAIASQANGLVITQPGSTRGVIEWNSFSIGRNNSVTFDNGSGATLNRVTGGSPSAIFGRLSATGSLYVINPQGIVVGPSGVISTGGRFVASTLDVCNDAFMQGGGSLTLSGDPNASVINLGKISSSSGDVFLIARHAVINAGTITAPNGTAELAAGEQVLLQDSGSSRQVFVQTGGQGTVVNKGRINAAQISLQAADGNVYALAGGGTRIRATGTADRDGHVWLVADGGRVSQLGKISASNADGSGGTVDTQAAQLAFGRHAAVHAGQWNLLTPTFTIDSAATRPLQQSLNSGTSVAVTTTGVNGATGDLSIASSLIWEGAASLTLAAYHNVSVTTGTTIANRGTGNLTVRADATGSDNGGSIANNGIIDWSASTGIVSALYDIGGNYSAGTILLNQAWTAPPDSGLVTQSTAYELINSLADLQKINQDLSGIYALGKDVDATPPSGTFNAPIGAFPASPFTGQFDGMGHTISNLKIQASPSDIDPGAGLFSAIGSGGVVRDLTVQGEVSGTANAGYYGILAGLLETGLNTSTIASVHTSGTVAVENAQEAGGLVGWSDGTITRSSSNADVSSSQGFSDGGLVGYNGGVIRQSFASGSVVGTSAYAGGLAGQNAGTITQSYATGAVSATDAAAGALVGVNLYSSVEQSFATGSVQGQGGGGGIAGFNYGPVTISSDVFWNTQTTGATVAVVSVAHGAQVGNAQGLTTAQMSNPVSFGPTYDFGPGGVWAMPAGATHPVLRWQLGQ